MTATFTLHPLAIEAGHRALREYPRWAGRMAARYGVDSKEYAAAHARALRAYAMPIAAHAPKIYTQLTRSPP